MHTKSYICHFKEFVISRSSFSSGCAEQSDNEQMWEMALCPGFCKVNLLWYNLRTVKFTIFLFRGVSFDDNVTTTTIKRENNSPLSKIHLCVHPLSLIPDLYKLALNLFSAIMVLPFPECCISLFSLCSFYFACCI